MIIYVPCYRDWDGGYPLDKGYLTRERAQEQCDFLNKENRCNNWEVEEIELED